MFRARKRLFKDRLRWHVSSDAEGREIDRYDALSPKYLIAVNEQGCHEGSLRLLPTTGDTLLKDHFAATFDGTPIESPRIWECTRFCIENVGERRLSRTCVNRVTAELLLGMCEVSLSHGLSRIIGMFDPANVETFERAGWAPELIGSGGKAHQPLFLGAWAVSDVAADSLRGTLGIVDSILEKPLPAAPQRSGAA